MGVATMAERGKKSEPKPAAELPKPKYDAPVKLRKEFKEKVDDVAADLGVYPGELIEMQMGDFIHGEWTRVLEEKLRRARQSGPK